MIINGKQLGVIRRNTKKRIVLATGTFDLFHAQHLDFLEKAKAQGDTLVVAVKNDKCARLKGDGRPIIGERDRIKIVDALKCVDYTTMVDFTLTSDYDDFPKKELKGFTEPQRQWIIMFDPVFEQLRPDILYYEDNPVLQKARQYMFKKYGAKGVKRKRNDEISTSKIIAKIIEDFS